MRLVEFQSRGKTYVGLLERENPKTLAIWHFGKVITLKRERCRFVGLHRFFHGPPLSTPGAGHQVGKLDIKRVFCADEDSNES